MELLGTPSNATLRQQFLENFGQSNKDHVLKAKSVMNELELVPLFRQFESRQVQEIEHEINEVPTEEIQPILRRLLQSMRGRKL
jgi:hypothetical protein